MKKVLYFLFSGNEITHQFWFFMWLVTSFGFCYVHFNWAQKMEINPLPSATTTISPSDLEYKLREPTRPNRDESNTGFGY